MRIEKVTGWLFRLIPERVKNAFRDRMRGNGWYCA